MPRFFLLFILLIAARGGLQAQMVPARVTPALAVGDGHVLALKGDGSVWAWGRNNYGQLGLGAAAGTADVRTPTRVTALDGKQVMALAAGFNHSMALTAAGEVYVWGRNDHGQSGNGTKAASGVYGSSNVPVRVINRHVYSLDGSTFTSLPMPAISQIAAGGSHCLALPRDYEPASYDPATSERAVLAWGANARGQTGTNTTVDQLWPRPSTFRARIFQGSAEGSEITGIAAGLNHSLLTSTSTQGSSSNALFVSGDNTYGQAGGMAGGTLSSVHVQAFFTAEPGLSARAGANHSMAFAALLYLSTQFQQQTQLYNFGRNVGGQIGNGSASASAMDYLWTALTAPKMSAVAPGANHNLALRQDGSVVVWGENGTYQLGLGNTADRTVATLLPSMADVVMVAAGGNSSFAVKRDGTVWAWGANVEGQLGLGTSANKTTPTKLTAFSMWGDTDADGVDDAWEQYYFQSLAADLSLDPDQDGLSSRQEYDLKLNPLLADTDGDLLPDGYEAAYSTLSPNIPNAIGLDYDGDGLSALEELAYNSSPESADTDADGIGDAVEAAQGSDPANAGDGGAAPAANEKLELELTVGDPSGSHSERYAMIITDAQTGKMVITHQAPTFGELGTKTYGQFRRGRAYLVELRHLGTDPAKLSSEPSFYPDFDWAMEIKPVGSDSGRALENLYSVLDAWDPKTKALSTATGTGSGLPVDLLVQRDDLPNHWDGRPDRIQEYKVTVATKRVLLQPIAYDSTDYARGFDPPASNQVAGASRPLTDTYYTSVCQTPTPVIVPTDVDLNLNNHIRVLFGSDEVAALHDVELATGDDAKVTLTVVGGMKAETVVTLEGKPLPDQAPGIATVLVYRKDDTASPRTPLAALKVDVLPLVTLSCGIWKVRDSTRPNTSIVAAIDQARLSGIFERIKLVYRPACITFTPVIGGPDIDARYDLDVPDAFPGGPLSKNDQLDGVYSYTGTSGNPIEWNMVEDAIHSVANAKVNVAFVRYASFAGLGRVGETIFLKSFSFVRTDNRESTVDWTSFERVCAHEIGHQFDLSSRGGVSHHDSGPYPTDRNGKIWVSIMFQTEAANVTEWLRNEDWRRANVNGLDRERQAP